MPDQMEVVNLQLPVWQRLLENISMRTIKKTTLCSDPEEAEEMESYDIPDEETE